MTYLDPTNWADAIAAVQSVSALVEQVVASGDGVTAATWLADVQGAARRLDAARVALVGVVDRSQVWAVQDYQTPASFLRHELRVDHRSARCDVAAARALAYLPTLAAAFAAGQVSRTAVDKIISVGTRNRARAALLPQFEAIFTDVAVTQPFALLVRALELWAGQVDPLPIIDSEDRAFDRRYLNLTRVSDGWLVDGFLSPEQGAAVAAAVNAVLTRTRRQANAKITDPHAPDPDSAGTDGAADAADAAGGPDFVIVDTEPGQLPITDWPQDPSQARADALVDLARLGAASGELPACGGIAPTVIVTVPLARLQAPCTKPVIPTTPNTTTPNTTTPNTTTPNTTTQTVRTWQDSAITASVSNGPGDFLISAKTAQRLTCDCTIHRLVLDPAGMPLDVGRSTRTIPKQLRIALNQRDKGCAYPGCERPPGWCAAHHIEHWAHGGSTDLQNLLLLCDRHHHKIHDTHHTITIEPGGKPKITKPRW